MLADYLKTHENNHTHSALGSLLQRVKHIQTLNQTIATCLPHEQLLLRHCLAVKIDNTTLILIAENPHWATRMRFISQQLLKALQQHPTYHYLTKIHCKVNPPLHHPTKQSFIKPRKMEISANSAALLRETAEKILDPAIQKAMRNIAAKEKNK